MKTNTRTVAISDQIHAVCLSGIAAMAPMTLKAYEDTLRTMALELLPTTARGEVRADGNCFFRAVGLLVRGTQDAHAEIRARCVDRVRLK